MPVSRAALASFGLAAAVSAALLLVPTVGTATGCVATTAGATAGSASPPSAQSCHSDVGHESLLRSQGWGVAVPLLIPILISGAAVAAWRTAARRAAVSIAAGLLFGFVVLGALSIGLFYVPSAVAMFMARGPGKQAVVAT